MFKKFLIWIGVIIVVIIVGLVILGHLAFSNEEIQYAPSLNVNMNGIISLNKKLTNGDFLFFNVGSKNLDLTLNKDEINAAFSIYLSGSNVANFLSSFQNNAMQPATKVNYLEFNNGEFTAYISNKLQTPSIFGSYLNIKTKVTPTIENKKLTLVFHSLEVGRLHIPSVIANIVFNIASSTINNMDSIKSLINSVTYLKTNENGIRINYNTGRFSDFISSFSLFMQQEN